LVRSMNQSVSDRIVFNATLITAYQLNLTTLHESSDPESNMSTSLIVSFVFSCAVATIFCITLFFCRTMQMITADRRAAIKKKSFTSMNGRLSDNTMEKGRLSTLVPRTLSFRVDRKGDNDSDTSESFNYLLSQSQSDTAIDTSMASECISPTLRAQFSEVRNSTLVTEETQRASKRRRSLRRVQSMSKNQSSEEEEVLPPLPSQPQPAEDSVPPGSSFMSFLMWSQKRNQPRCSSTGSESGTEATRHSFCQSLTRQVSEFSTTIDDVTETPRFGKQRSLSCRVGNDDLGLKPTVSPEKDIDIGPDPEIMCKVDPAREPPPQIDRRALAHMTSIKSDGRRNTICMSPRRHRSHNTTTTSSMMSKLI